MREFTTMASRRPVQKVSAPEGIRTPNLLIRSQMLYPLSYGRMLLARAHNVVQNTSRQAGARIETGVIGAGVEGAQLALQRDPAV